MAVWNQSCGPHRSILESEGRRSHISAVVTRLLEINKPFKWKLLWMAACHDVHRRNVGCSISWPTREMASRPNRVTWQPTSTSSHYWEAMHRLPDANQSPRDLSAVWLVQIYSSSQPSTFIKDDLSHRRKRMLSRQMLKCNAKFQAWKAKTVGLFHSYSKEDEKGGKNVEQKHQRAIEEGVKRKKSCEIFSTRSQQVVKSAMQGYGFISMNNGWCLYLRNLVICFLPNWKRKAIHKR